MTSHDIPSHQVLATLELIWLILFSIEMALKIYALNLTGMDAYLNDSWNRLDGALVLLGWLDYLPFGFINLTAFRLTRSLRALRVMSHNEEMRILLASIGSALSMSVQVLSHHVITSHHVPSRHITNHDPTSNTTSHGMSVQVLFLLGFISFVFGIMGVQFFGGATRQRCSPIGFDSTNITPAALAVVAAYPKEGPEMPFTWVPYMCGGGARRV